MFHLRSLNGVILYRGPSLIDRSPIVAIANCMRSTAANRKTGTGVQTYILRADMPPNEAVDEGHDRSICGDCPLRPIKSGVCYVEIGKGVHWTWDAWKRGQYPGFDYGLCRDLFHRRYVRIGTYGDPAAVPFSVWSRVVNLAANHSGYTHQWRTCDQRLRTICMASVDLAEDAEEARAMGWRTFRVRLPESPIEEGEIVCPASDEGGRADCVPSAERAAATGETLRRHIRSPSWFMAGRGKRIS